MSRALRELERIEHRVLGALRFVDAATGRERLGPLELSAVEGTARFVRSRSGLQVLWDWSGLREHASAFTAPPGAPPTGSVPFRFEVRDPTGEYLPRRASLDLPRNPDPDLAHDPDSLFQPATVPLYRAPAAPTGPNWAVIRATVTDAASGARLGGAVLTVTRGERVIARGLTDGRGEGVVPVVGIPMLTFGAEPDPDDEEDDGAVVVDSVAVRLRAAFSSAAGTRMTEEALRSGRRPPTPTVDPDAVEADEDSARTEEDVNLGARRSHALTLTLDLS